VAAGQEHGMEQPRPRPSKRQRLQFVKKNVKGGTEAYYQATASLPPGPADIQQFMNWPAQQILDLQAARLLLVRRLEALCQFGLVLHTDFSGKQCPETVFLVWLVRLVGDSFGWKVGWQFWLGSWLVGACLEIGWLVGWLAG